MKFHKGQLVRRRKPSWAQVYQPLAMIISGPHNAVLNDNNKSFYRVYIMKEKKRTGWWTDSIVSANADELRI